MYTPQEVLKHGTALVKACMERGNLYNASQVIAAMAPIVHHDDINGLDEEIVLLWAKDIAGRYPK